MSWWRPTHVGYAVRTKLADVGMGARLFARLLGL
ncbi:MAG: ABC transporter permease, partial [Acidovorax sp.]|nr:ABC transporter permease [Acidovorax sp.]